MRVPIAAEDEQLILAHFRTRNPHYYPFVSFLLGTGCRPSEATGLTWQHVDLRSGRVTIAQSRVRGHLSATKTAASSRTITLALHLVELLRERQPLVVGPIALVASGTAAEDGHGAFYAVFASLFASLRCPRLPPKECQKTTVGATKRREDRTSSGSSRATRGCKYVLPLSGDGGRKMASTT